MNTDELITRGNEFRAQNQPAEALKCYAHAFGEDMNSVAAFNNYGNVLRECGHAKRAIPFLQAAIEMAPQFVTAQFNLAVAYLISGDYARGWPQYEWRWRYEHLDGLLPKFEQPRWSGEDLKDKTILVIGEQGHGDNIQFIRFVEPLIAAGAKVYVHVDENTAALFRVNLLPPTQVITNADPLPAFDYWTPIMSIPGIIGITLENLQHRVQYLTASRESIQQWQQVLGPKKGLRIGVCWSGRKDSWINQHKAIPFAEIFEVIQRNPEYHWINLQADCSEEEGAALAGIGVSTYPGAIRNWDDTAGLIQHLDVVIAVDTAVGHLAGAMGRPFWLPLNQFGQDWRWLLDREDSPWYPTCRIFRQPSLGDWTTPLKKIEQYLTWFKV